MEKNQIAEVTIQDMTENGEGIGKVVDGVVGDGDAPGDRACDEFKKREGKVGHDPSETYPSYDLLSC